MLFKKGFSIWLFLIMLIFSFNQFITLITYEDDILQLSGFHHGDLTLEGNKKYIIKDTTFFVDGNIIVKDSAKLIIRNAVVIVNNTYFQQYFIYLLDNSTLEISNSEIRDNYILKDPPLLTIQHHAQLVMINSTIDWQIGAKEGAKIVINNSRVPILGWDPAAPIFGPLEVTIVNSHIKLIEVRFPREMSEQIELVELKQGKNENICLMVYDSFLKLKNTWLELGWDISLPAHYETQNKNHIVIRNSSIYQLWLAFPSHSKVKMNNIKPGLFLYWNLRENTQTANVTFDVTLINTYVKIWKLSFYGEGSIENINVFTLDTSSNEGTILFANNCTIGQFHNRGGKYIRFSNTVITERVRFVSWSSHPGAPEGFGYPHRGKSIIKFENSTINAPYIEIANHDAFINGTLSILTPVDGILWYSGTITREYLLLAREVQGLPLSNISISLVDWNGVIIWNGVTNQQGKALFNITFTRSNYTREFMVVVTVGEVNISKNVGFLTSTPIIFTIRKELLLSPIWVYVAIVGLYYRYPLSTFRY